ncbi:DUF1045 domain-containing protein [Bradyrhizobium sp. ARR65]|uniref:DUF1045 domain-containing protein n=1 Tax=Bradyrhizobium sp. ARR65 TaxID=1040989 RepID=UPI000462EBA9|nr:DUF1045 domain-containing protein [Bradyrhizobium sp. ARR65]
MSPFSRYAIYYAPQHESALERFGAQLLGYDAFTGADLRFPEHVTQMMPDWRELTADPRKYGFHATLKAPFALAEGTTENELVAACTAFAETPRPAPTIRPVIDSISGFIAVIPAGHSSELQRLAQDCVTSFDGFRAPLTAQDRARRNPEKLTPRQCEYLDRWSYPYVMDEFRFHMTLTGRLEAPRRDAVLDMLRNAFSTLGIEALAIDRIALFRQDEPNSRFRIMQAWQLAAA